LVVNEQTFVNDLMDVIGMLWICLCGVNYSFATRVVHVLSFATSAELCSVLPLLHASELVPSMLPFLPGQRS
jgi:hypothetical protein